MAFSLAKRALRHALSLFQAQKAVEFVAFLARACLLWRGKALKTLRTETPMSDTDKNFTDEEALRFHATASRASEISPPNRWPRSEFVARLFAGRCRAG